MERMWKILNIILIQFTSCVICPGNYLPSKLNNKKYKYYIFISFVGPWGGPLLAKLGYQVPLKPVKIPVYYWEAPDFLPHTWICEREDGKHFWGLPALEYPGLAKVGEFLIFFLL